MSISKGAGSSDPTDQLSSERSQTAAALSARSTDAEEDGNGVHCPVDGGTHAAEAAEVARPAARAADVTRLREDPLLTGVRKESLQFLADVVGVSGWMLGSVTSVTRDGGVDSGVAGGVVSSGDRGFLGVEGFEERGEEGSAAVSGSGVVAFGDGDVNAVQA